MPLQCKFLEGVRSSYCFLHSPSLAFLTWVLALGYKLMHGLRFMPWARANAAAIAAIRPLHGLAEGIPTDAAIDNLLWRFGRSDLPA